MADRHAGVSNADLRLGGVLLQVFEGRRLGAQAQRRFRTSLPIAEQSANLLEELLPRNIAGDGQDGATRPEVTFVMLTHHSRLDLFDALASAPAVVTQRFGIMPAAQLDEEFLPRLIFESLQILKSQCLDGIDFLGRQARSEE